jgi:alginate O-acetyltransferase complex protein AlgI
MVFSSVFFLVYFLPVFLLIYLYSPQRCKNSVILLASIFFYSWGAPRFIFVILGTTLIDFYLVRLMYESVNRKKRKLLMILSLSINVGLLFYFKYYGFFISNLNEVLSYFNIQCSTFFYIVLPIGISFYTFETITYIVDVYRGVHAPLKSFRNYQLYIILFPKLIAGPIIRYHEIADQLEDRSANETLSNRIAGFVRFVTGLSKKVLIANVMGQYADTVFAYEAADISTSTAWLGILSYTMQIYFDFSGYSDMAIGLGMMMGFIFPENFNNPYISQSITEFWRRWHITLGAWMRNYLYIPLGGNKVSTGRLYLNLWLVFLASGLWHGASWNFIIWGAFHGFFLVIERSGLAKIYKTLGKYISVILTFFIVLNGWVFFRIERLPEAMTYFTKMYSFQNGAGLLKPETGFFSILVVALLFSFITLTSIGKRLEDIFYTPVTGVARLTVTSFIAIILFIYCLSTLAVSGFNPFIYFRF